MYFKVNAIDMPNKPHKQGSWQDYWTCPIVSLCNCVSEETLCQSSYTPKKALFPFNVGPLTYNLFHSLYSILSDAEEEQEKYWVKLNKETLTYFWNEFEDDGKHKLPCIGELALLFACIFGRMLLTIGLENTKNVQITWYAV
jgi:hypothetical protein